MSLSASDLASELTAVLQPLHVEDCCAVAATTLVLYDHMRTFARETDLIWGQRISSTTIVFHLNRWLGFTWAVTNLVSVFVPIRTLASCIGSNLYIAAITLALYIPWAVFSTIRVHAISGGNWYLSATVCLLSLVPVGTNAYAHFTAATYQLMDNPLLGTTCGAALMLSPRANVALAVSTRACLLVADLLVILLTWARTFRSNRKPDSGNARMNSLSTLLLRDGTLYFIILSALNILNLVGIVTASFNYATSFVTPLYCIIVSHFLLDLRGLAQMSQEVSNDNYAVSSHMSNAASLPVFKTIDSTSSRVDLFDTDRHLNWREEEEKAM